jgi:hypothetical protein
MQGYRSVGGKRQVLFGIPAGHFPHPPLTLPPFRRNGFACDFNLLFAGFRGCFFGLVLPTGAGHFSDE